MDEFKKFTTRFRCEKGKSYTHTSIGNPKFSLHIPDANMSEFYEVYAKALVKGVKLHLTEKPTDPSPMRIDLDFRYPLPANRVDLNVPLPRQYATADIERILSAYYNILSKFINNNENFTCYVMEKPHPVEYRGKMKDGIHVIWPGLIVPNAFQHMIRTHILECAAEIFNGMNLCNPFEDIVDQAIIDRNNWQLYGSRKPDCEAYQVTNIYTWNHLLSEIKKLPNPSATEELTFVELFSMRGKEGNPAKFNEDSYSEYEEFTRHILPSIDDRRKLKLHNEIFSRSQNMMKNYVSEDEYILAGQLVSECLSYKRAENYEDWIKLGWTLRNIDYRLIDCWIEFSKVNSKYVEGECQDLWNKMRSDTLGMGTLKWWARNDNPIKFKEIQDTNVCLLIDQCIGTQGAHFDVAKVVHAMFKDEYRFTVKDTWYTYVKEKHRWVRTREGLKLRLILSQDIFNKFAQRAIYWNTEAMKAADENTRSLINSKVQVLNDICKKLKSSGYKNSVMTECKGLFTDEKFEELLDSHPHLIGFENGVYDLKMHEFREGLADDYISYCTNRHYLSYVPDSEEACEIRNYLSKVFVNEEVRRYVMDIFSCIIDGSIRQEKFYIFTGSGCHAIDTDILMFDGTKKKVQDIQLGDKLMGDDSTPRNVLKLYRGKSTMYRVIPKKGESFVVNEDHKISLKVSLSSAPRITTTSKEYRVKWLNQIFYTEEDGSIVEAKEKCFCNIDDAKEYLIKLNNTKGVLQLNDVVDVQVKNYIQFNMHNMNLYLFRPDIVRFEEQPIDIDPYILGCWLGDGTSRLPNITNMDKEVIEYFNEHMPENHKFNELKSSDNGLAKTYSITFGGKKNKSGNQNVITNGLRKYNLIQNKHIPHDYKCNSRENRLKLLAGIIDTDGTYQKHTNQYTISQKNERLIDDIIDLVRSLGLACYKKEFQGKCHYKGKVVVGTYYRINIVGKGIEEIPCLIPRKQAIVRNKGKNVLLNNFSLEKLPEDNYYGVEVDNNHRYLMGDFLVTANSNSKSVILNFLQKAVGDYYCILPIALLTQKRAASNTAQSELERTKGRRFAIMQEPGESEKINIGLMKELSGGDRILVRGLFKEPIEFKPQFTMIMTCNEMPEVPSDDGGTWRRIRVIEFLSKFVEKPDPNNKLEFPLDIELMEKIDRWADTFISMLIAHHKEIDPKNISEPWEVRKATESYKKNNDIIGQYVNEKMEKTDNDSDVLQLNRVYLDFKIWCGQILPKGKKVPDRGQFKVYVEKTFGIYPTNGRGWRCARLKAAMEQGDSDVE